MAPEAPFIASMAYYEYQCGESFQNNHLFQPTQSSAKKIVSGFFLAPLFLHL
jgi:hypothetical protein